VLWFSWSQEYLVFQEILVKMDDVVKKEMLVPKVQSDLLVAMEKENQLHVDLISWI
jgi:hypothetical protein